MKEQHGDDDAGDEVDDQVEGVAIDSGDMVPHTPSPRCWPVDPVEDHRHGQPEDRLVGVTVGNGDEAEHAADCAECRYTVDQPAHHHGMAEGSGLGIGEIHLDRSVGVVG